MQHHYVVREIDVMGVCDCSGHGNGLVCPVNSKTGLRECQCLGNTCGPKCDRCCPGFNQYLLKPSTAPSWGFDPASACERKFISWSTIGRKILFRAIQRCYAFLLNFVMLLDCTVSQVQL